MADHPLSLDELKQRSHPKCARSMSPVQIHRFSFVRSVDMTGVTYACMEKRPELSLDAGNGNSERLPSPTKLRHQTDYSSELSGTA